MKYTITALISLTLLSACATPETVLSSHNGNIVTCGGSSTGSILGGMIGYSIQKSNDDQCVKQAIANGYKPMKIGETQVIPLEARDVSQ